MKKAKGIKKVVCVTVALVTIIVFSGVALADITPDTAHWKSTVCLNGFTTQDNVDKTNYNLQDHLWTYISPWLKTLQFNSTPQNNALCITPKTSSGLSMGSATWWTLQNWPPNISITKYRSYNKIYLRIDNLNQGNNMESEGYWDGFVAD